MNFGLDDVLEQNEFVERSSKPAAIQINTGLSLNPDYSVEDIVVRDFAFLLSYILGHLLLILNLCAFQLRLLRYSWLIQNFNCDVGWLFSLVLAFYFFIDVTKLLMFLIQRLLRRLNLFLICQVLLTSLLSSRELFDWRHHFARCEAVGVRCEVFYWGLHRAKHFIQASSLKLSRKNLNLPHLNSSYKPTSMALYCDRGFNDCTLCFSTLLFQLEQAVLNLRLVL